MVFKEISRSGRLSMVTTVGGGRRRAVDNLPSLSGD